jgi:hypothetical protein
MFALEALSKAPATAKTAALTAAKVQRMINQVNITIIACTGKLESTK